MRHPLGDGQWAIFRDRLTYAQGRAVRVALLEAEKDRAKMADLDLALVGAYVSEWYVRDLAGEPVMLPSWPIEAATPLPPDDIIQSIAVLAMKAWKGRLDLGKDTAANSPPTPPARRRSRSTS